MMDRRGFLAALGVGVFAPKFGRWHKQGSGLLVPRPTVWVPVVEVAKLHYVTEYQERDIVWRPKLWRREATRAEAAAYWMEHPW